VFLRGIYDVRRKRVMQKMALALSRVLKSVCSVAAEDTQTA